MKPYVSDAKNSMLPFLYVISLTPHSIGPLASELRVPWNHPTAHCTVYTYYVQCILYIVCDSYYVLAVT